MPCTTKRPGWYVWPITSVTAMPDRTGLQISSNAPYFSGMTYTRARAAVATLPKSYAMTLAHGDPKKVAPLLKKMLADGKSDTEIARELALSNI